MNTELQANRDYADLISSMMLCSFNNPNDDKALRKCLKFVKRRIKSFEIKQMCQVVIRTKETTPSQWLINKVEEIEAAMPLPLFFKSARKDVD